MIRSTTPRRWLRPLNIVRGAALLGMILTALMYVLPAPSVSGQIIYQIDWDWGKAQKASDSGSGWTTTNDLGYRVTLTRGYVVSYRTTMMECAHRHNLLSYLIDLMAPRKALGGHGGGTDPAELTVSYIESLAQPAPVELGKVTVNEPGYCQGHYLVARADSRVVNLPTDKDMFAVSLFIEGQYRAPQSETQTTFTIQSSLAWGTNADLYALVEGTMQQVHVEIGNQPVRLTIRRQLDSLFDSVDFVNMSEDDQARAVLRSLMGHTRLIITGGKISPYVP